MVHIARVIPTEHEAAVRIDEGIFEDDVVIRGRQVIDSLGRKRLIEPIAHPRDGPFRDKSRGKYPIADGRVHEAKLGVGMDHSRG